MKFIEAGINFIYRMVFGIICIYFLNRLVKLAGLELQVGLNGWTAAAAGVLGLPGVVLLFAVLFIGVL